MILVADGVQTLKILKLVNIFHVFLKKSNLKNVFGWA